MRLRLLLTLMLSLSTVIGCADGSADDDSSEYGDDDASEPGDDDATLQGDDDATTPGDDDTTTPGDDDASVPGDDDATTPGDDDATTPGDDDASVPGDDDATTPGDDDASVPGDDDATTPGDDDASVPGDDDATAAGDDDATAAGDDDATATGDDDATATGDDDATTTGDDDATAPTDADSDGYPASVDCDDHASSVHPGANELCDGIDDNCDGVIDENTAVDASIWYLDSDGDGYGETGVSRDACNAPVGYALLDGDCDDADVEINPDAQEICDGADNDCDGLVDATPAGAPPPGDAASWYVDADGDGYGSSSGSVTACTAPAGYVASSNDCDDTRALVYPGAPEHCNGLDDNCNGVIDDNATDAQTWHADNDGDGYGDPATVKKACQKPDGYLKDGTDCDDASAATYPGATEVCDGQDNNCNGAPDEGLAENYYRDADQDGFGGAASATTCAPANGYVRSRGDCNDADPKIHPGADDPSGDNIDQDCGGTFGPEPHVGYTSSSKTTIQAALDAAQAGVVVWVGPGTYNEHDLSFKGKAITLISSHYADLTVIDALAKGRVFNFSTGETPYSILDGFTLFNGKVGSGAGMYIKSSHPTVKNCTIQSSVANDNGGALYLDSANPTFTDCLINGNTVTNSYGGGVYMTSSSASFTRVIFKGNAAGNRGGAMYLNLSSPKFYSCSFIGNRSNYGGAGYIYNKSSPTFDGCNFDGNSSKNEGGALYLNSYSNPALANSRFDGNASGTEGGALYLTSYANPLLTNVFVQGNAASSNGGAMSVHGSSPTLSHCTLTNNTTSKLGGGIYLTGSGTVVQLLSTAIAYNSSYNAYVSSSGQLKSSFCALYNPNGQNLSGAALDDSSLAIEPEFLAYDSKGQPSDIHLALTSPLIDAGNPGEEDADGSRSDIGAYGGAAGGDYDLDGDGYPQYFWPGELTDAPSGFSPADYDCDDLDDSVHLCD